jgi:hypothetical protein
MDTRHGIQTNFIKWMTKKHPNANSTFEWYLLDDGVTNAVRLKVCDEHEIESDQVIVWWTSNGFASLNSIEYLLYNKAQYFYDFSQNQLDGIYRGKGGVSNHTIDQQSLPSITFENSDDVDPPPLSSCTDSNEIKKVESILLPLADTLKPRESGWGSGMMFMLYIFVTSSFAVAFIIAFVIKLFSAKTNE